MTESATATRDDVLEQVRRQTCETFNVPPEEVGDTTVFLDIEGAESIRLLRLVSRLEHHYDVVLMSEDAPVVQTVGELTDHLVRAQGTRA
ncbi:acyl carrier protein [Nonomuraea solani]|uniref:Acyl carrier protein n=1 Tax=Nonomuraea solani TaxID=1144553 RepID=A0A1H6ECJ3_9ACTN|nr:acyl carrier protein [Nonomuraea solani]SEG95497.1 acyl carrier protein [Nonomuraea solani]